VANADTARGSAPSRCASSGAPTAISAAHPAITGPPANAVPRTTADRPRPSGLCALNLATATCVLTSMPAWNAAKTKVTGTKRVRR